MTKQDLEKNIASQPSPLAPLPEGEGDSTDFSLSENSTCAFPHADRWKETTLGEVVKFVNDKIEIEKVNLDNYISTENLLPDKLGIQKATTLPNISKVNCFKKEDTLFSNIRTYFKKVWFANIDGGSSNDVLIFRPINDRVLDKKFLYYLISSDMFINFTVISAKGTKMPRGDKDAMRTFKINLPPLLQQKAIAGMLGVFDDKIELLREQNETLEKIGDILFEKFFKLPKQYPHPQSLSQRERDSNAPHSNPLPKGEEALPDGWRVGKITEIIKREPVSYKCIKKDLDDKGKTPILDQGKNGLYGYTNREPDFEASKENPVIIFTNHTCNFWFVDYPFCAIQNVLPYRGIDGYDEYFLYFMTKGSISFIEYKGHWPNFVAKDFIIPPVEKAQEFSKIAKPLLQKISENKEQIQTLSQTRDTLLPKLMKGEIILSEK